MGRPKKIGDGVVSINEAVSAAISGDKSTFDINKFKKSKNLVNNSKYKEQTYIPASPALQKIISLPGIPQGHITLLRGHSDTGKTTALLEIAINCQKRGIMPVFIITEMKWSWQHALSMGFEASEATDEAGRVVFPVSECPLSNVMWP